MINKKGLIYLAKVWGFILGLNLFTWYVWTETYNQFYLLALRLVMFWFFMYLLLSFHRQLKQNKSLMKDGFIEYQFNPWYVMITLILVLAGLSWMMIADYLFIPAWYMFSYFIIVAIFPFITFKIPFPRRRGKWRR